MRGAFKVATVFGVPVLIHWTFMLILAGAFYWGYARGGWVSAFWVLGLMLTLFFCVLLHEFGHALVAKYYNVTTKDIILSPIGGVARLTRLPKLPMQEFLVAAAGPAVNIFIALLVSPYFFLSSKEKQIQFFGAIFPSNNVFINDLTALDRMLLLVLFLNIFLALFNLLPAFPMDGGRILRALLTIKLERTTATRMTMYVGQALAILFIYLGITEFEYGAIRFSFVIALFGVFAFASATSEYRYVKFTQLLKDSKVANVFRNKWTPFYEEMAMEYPIEAYAKGVEKHFMVFDQWHNLKGVLSEYKLKEALKKKDFGGKISQYMDRIPRGILIGDSAELALETMQKYEIPALPVYERGKFVGIIDENDLSNFANNGKK